MCSKLVHFYKSSMLWSLVAAFRMTSASWLYPETDQEGEASHISAIMKWESHDIRKQKTPWVYLFFFSLKNTVANIRGALYHTLSLLRPTWKNTKVFQKTERCLLLGRKEGIGVGRAKWKSLELAGFSFGFPRGGYRVGLFIMSDTFRCLYFFVSVFL